MFSIFGELNLMTFKLWIVSGTEFNNNWTLIFDRSGKKTFIRQQELKGRKQISYFKLQAFTKNYKWQAVNYLRQTPCYPLENPPLKIYLFLNDFRNKSSENNFLNGVPFQSTSPNKLSRPFGVNFVVNFFTPKSTLES